MAGEPWWKPAGGGSTGNYDPSAKWRAASPYVPGATSTPATPNQVSSQSAGADQLLGINPNAGTSYFGKNLGGNPNASGANIGAATGTPPPPPPGGYPLATPGAAENFYSQHGNDLMDPSASEKLFAEGDAGSNPFYDYAEGRATDSINAAERARGGYNSGAALAEIGNSSAYLRGQQAHELGQLAGQSDTQRLGRYGLTGQMADTAESQQQNRIMGGINAEMGLDSSQAGQVGGFYGTAGGENQQAQMASIEAKLQASGMPAAEIKQYMDILGGLGSAAIKAIPSGGSAA